jgi:hypothetical protein
MAHDISEYEMSHNGEWDGVEEVLPAVKEHDLEECLTDAESTDGADDGVFESTRERRKLTQTSVKMALAIALHNFPEGKPHHWREYLLP